MIVRHRIPIASHYASSIIIQILAVLAFFKWNINIDRSHSASGVVRAQLLGFIRRVLVIPLSIIILNHRHIVVVLVVLLAIVHQIHRQICMSSSLSTLDLLRQSCGFFFCVHSLGCVFLLIFTALVFCASQLDHAIALILNLLLQVVIFLKLRREHRTRLHIVIAE